VSGMDGREGVTFEYLDCNGSYVTETFYTDGVICVLYNDITVLSGTAEFSPQGVCGIYYYDQNTSRSTTTTFGTSHSTTTTYATTWLTTWSTSATVFYEGNTAWNTTRTTTTTWNTTLATTTTYNTSQSTTTTYNTSWNMQLLIVQ